MKKITIPQRLISFILAAAILLSAVCVGASAEEKLTFTGRFYTDCGEDLSGIKIDVYISSLITSRDAYEKYSNDYAFSAYTDKNGRFQFKRPDGVFVIRVDMSTLPKKTGITENLWTIADSGIISVTADVNRIKYIKIDSSNVESGEVKVHIQSADRTNIFCEHTVDISDKKVTESVADKSGKRTYKTKQTITVKANGVKKTKTLTGEYTETATPVVSLKKPEYDHPRSYTEAGGFFTIHYDKKQYSESTVKNIYDTFSDAKNFFDVYGFHAPKKESGSEKYNIYLITTGGAAATTRHVKKGSSYIIMLTPADYSREKYAYQTSAIAHELFHAIMYTYTRAYDISPDKWFREAFANWAGSEYLRSSTSTLKKYIDIFQSNPELPLTSTYDSRIYGAMLFPLTISEYYGGIYTVRRILEQFKNIGTGVPAPEMEAISRGLSAANPSYSRTGAFMRFALNNMDPSRYYSLKGCSSWNSAVKSTDSFFDSVSLTDLECKPLSVKYYDTLPKLATKSEYITICDNKDKYSNIALCCVIKKKSGMYSDFTDSVSGFTTYRIKNFTGLKTSVVSFGLINTSLSRTQDITVKIAYA